MPSPSLRLETNLHTKQHLLIRQQLNVAQLCDVFMNVGEKKVEEEIENATKAK